MTTHVFIVDATTFKYHLEYLFAGTGAKDEVIDFNNSSQSHLHATKENNLLGMIADSQRIRKGDFIIFYLQQNFQQGIREGKFFGVFRAKEIPSFLDNNDESQFLRNDLEKSLTFRTIIEAHKVYAEGVTEWEALDEIQNIHSPYQMLWSLIYRKLKGNRGNTMITLYESERLIKLIRDKNSRREIDSQHFSFDLENQKIVSSNNPIHYEGQKEAINIFPRMKEKFQRKLQFEVHLQAYLLQNLETQPFIEGEIEWIGNEVSCGVGMQRIDIFLSLQKNEERICVPIELKSSPITPEIILQVQRYIDWIRQYYIPNKPSDIQPIIVARKFENKNNGKFRTFIEKISEFNAMNNVLPLKYYEFEFSDGDIRLLEYQYL